MNGKPILNDSTNESKNIIRPRSSSNKFHSNNIHKLIKDMDFSNIKHAKLLLESKDKLINYFKNEQKVKNILNTKKENKIILLGNPIKTYVQEYEESKKILSEDQKRIQILEEKIREKQKLIEEKNKQKKIVEENILKLNQSIKERDNNIEKLQNDVDDMRNKNDDLDNKINDLADELEEADVDLDQNLDFAQPNVDEMTYEQLLELEEQMGSVSNGLTEEEIKSLKHDKFIKNKYLEDKCIICQYNFMELESIVGLSCKHCFHFACLKPWIEKQHYCPLCKSNIRKES
jgi:DNA repair exonuclease SbcCD ATPase subunit